MTNQQEIKLKVLLEKYNDILMVSMRLAIAEDLINLVIVNKDDTDFELSDLMKNKEDLSNFIIREFLKQNSSSVINDLRTMEEPLKELKKKFSK